MPSNLTVRIAGEGGEGVISTGDLLTSVVARTRHDVYTFRTYPAEIKGGPAMFQLRFADHPVLSAGTSADVLVAFNQEAVDLHAHELKKDGLLIFDSAQFDPPQKVARNTSLLGVPFTSIANDVVGLKRSKNMVALGVIGKLLGQPLAELKILVTDKFASRETDVLKKNIHALEEGYKWGQAHPLEKDWIVNQSVIPDRKLIMSGNEAMAAGAIGAGCRYYAGYPITPASEIFTFMEKELPRFGGIAIQTEDEIAAISSCIGASFAGTMAMTGTSGPGLSLMAETVGLASMTETPIVVIDVQRSGPSTGMPTKTEQSDLLFAIHMGHGDTPKVVLAPSSVKDCFYGVIRAFGLAEKYQIPVIVLSDQSLSHRTQTFTRPKLDGLTYPTRLKANKNGPYKRFADTENGVSPRAIPGEEGLNFVTTGLEHDEFGNPTWTPANHEKMSAKRHRKLSFISQEKGFTVPLGDDQATVGIICWGSTEGPVEEAIHVAERHGIKVKGLSLKMLHPLPDEEIRKFMANLKQVVVPELNFNGQLAQILRSRYLFPFRSFTKCGGIPFTPDEIVTKIEELIRDAG